MSIEVYKYVYNILMCKEFLTSVPNPRRSCVGGADDKTRITRIHLIRRNLNYDLNEIQENETIPRVVRSRF